MWLATPLSIEVSRSASLPIGAQFWDEAADAALDITGYSFYGSVANADGLAEIYSFPVEVTSYTLGTIDFIIDGAYLANLPGRQENVTLAYQIIASDNQNTKIVAVRGSIILTPGIYTDTSNSKIYVNYSDDGSYSDGDALIYIDDGAAS